MDKFKNTYTLSHYLKTKTICVLRKRSIQKRLLIALIMCALIPLLLISFMSSHYHSQAITSKVSDYSLQLLKQVDSSMVSELNSFQQLGDKLMVAPLIQDGLYQFNTSNDLDRNSTITRIADELLVNFSSLLKDIDVLTITTPDDEIFYDLGYDEIAHFNRNVLKNAVEEKGSDVWYMSTTRRGKKSLVLCREINNRYDYSHKLGYLYIGIPTSNFATNVFEDINTSNNSTEFLIITSQGQLITSTSPTTDSDSATPLINTLFDKVKEDENTFSIELDHEKYFIAYRYDHYSNWYVVTKVSYDYINADIYKFKRLIIIISSLSICMTVIVASLIYSSFITPMKAMLRSVDTIMAGHLDSRIQDDAPDELGHLSRSFDDAIDNINNLIHHVKQEQKEKRTTELHMLQAQINPHFLFNTLNSLKWTAMISGANTVSDGLAALSDLLRSTIVQSDSLVTINEEMDNIKNYILIQKLRYGDVFTVTYNIASDVEELLLPKLLLQPIIENAIIHGFTEETLDGQLIINAQSNNDILNITVEDNGIGFDPTIPTPKSTKKLSGIGIKNVEERIQLHYGTDYKLIIHSEKGFGTTVKLTLPIQRRNEVIDNV